MSFLGNLLGLGPKVNIQEIIENGAVVVDVRSPSEFKSGHVKGSQNIPLDRIKESIDKIKKWNKAVVVCCASGMRSGSAKSILKANGVEAYNAGSWMNI